MFVFIAFYLLILSKNLNSQELINFNEKNVLAKVHYNKFLYGIYEDYYNKMPNYPSRGTYSPTGWSLKGIKSGVGVCNYIYIPTNKILQPGRQYRISLTVKVVENYEDMPYYQDHFGIALSSDLFENHFGLWPKQFIPFGHVEANKLDTIEFEFRPLCTSEYLLLGVFQAPTMDGLNCFACQYDFELYSLTVEKSKNQSADFYYICDGFVEAKLDKWSYETDTIFFDSGLAQINEEYLTLLDSIPKKLRTVQDLVSLYAYTDKRGTKTNNSELPVMKLFVGHL